ncbi:uncharacterized protein LOC123891898 [Trifolium pratense]|uniref:uncharacterized protein LOC123891898 n=1 Tax=Trifolium pratense TaxID=57577 RepID=UPI001E69352F|nr:uncharacterized protein LOC123891898 [Trifolium pratense]
MLTALHYEVFLDFNGNMKTVVKLQLSDRRGRFDCELRGSSVTQFQSLFNNCYEGLPIVMLQFARVKMDKGYVFVESVDDVTRVLVDPHIAELISFKMGFKKKFSRCYIRSIAVKMKMIEKNYRLFDQCYPVKTLYDLVKSPVYGLFVTFAEMVEITNYDDWFYAVCDCQRNLIKYNSSFYCTECHRTSFRVSPKRKVEFVVGDSTGKAIFTAFDELITGCVSTRGNKMGLNKKDSYNSYSNFLGKNYLYVVRKTHGPNILLPDVFEVVEMTSDLTIIQSFLSKGSSYTPTKCIFKPSFSEIVPVDFDIIGTSNLGCCQGPSVVPVLQGFARSDCRLTAGEPIVAKRNLCHILEGVPLKKSRGI